MGKKSRQRWMRSDTRWSENVKSQNGDRGLWRGRGKKKWKINTRHLRPHFHYSKMWSFTFWSVGIFRMNGEGEKKWLWKVEKWKKNFKRKKRKPAFTRRAVISHYDIIRKPKQLLKVHPPHKKSCCDWFKAVISTNGQQALRPSTNYK